MICVECNKHYTISWSIPITDFFKFNLKIFLSDVLTGYVLYLHSWQKHNVVDLFWMKPKTL